MNENEDAQEAGPRPLEPPNSNSLTSNSGQKTPRPDGSFQKYKQDCGPEKTVVLEVKNPERVPGQAEHTGAACPHSAVTPSTRQTAQAVDKIDTEARAQSELLRSLQDLRELSHIGTDAEVDVELQKHIEALHAYNEIKDLGQLLFGKLAERQGVTTRDIYAQFGVSLED